VIFPVALVTGAELANLQSLADQIEGWEDASSTAGEAIRDRKHAKHAPDDASALELARAAGRALHSPIIDYLIGPYTVNGAGVLRYDQGDSYGWHMDAAAHGHARRDVAVSLLISDRSHYSSGGAIEIKVGALTATLDAAAAGTALLWPACFAHRVTEIPSGRRVVVVASLHCAIADPFDRELLRRAKDLRTEAIKSGAEGAELDALAYVLCNLERRLRA
jgi:PKHD-type hydroxylase